MSDRQDERGFSLVEVLVTMALTSVVLLAIGLVFNSTLRTTSRITVRSDTTFDARATVDAISRRVRVAYPAVPGESAFRTMQPEEMSFYASINGGATGIVAARELNPAPTIVTYRLIDVTRDAQATKCLQESLVTATGDGNAFSFTPPAADRSTCLAFGTISGQISIEDPQPLFQYFTDDKDLIDLGTEPTTEPCAVTSVQIAVRVSQPSSGGTASTSASSRIVANNIVDPIAACAKGSS